MWAASFVDGKARSQKQCKSLSDLLRLKLEEKKSKTKIFTLLSCFR